MPDRLPILENTPLFTVLALLVTGFCLWRIRSGRFRQIRRLHFVLAAALFWGVLASLLILSAWERYYGHFAPPYYRFAAPLAALLVYPLWALLLRWLAARLPGNPAASFCLLGGMQGVIEHYIAITRLNILQAPMLQDSPPQAVLGFAFFEYIVYWGLVLLLADLVGLAWDRYRPAPSGQAGAFHG
jgi:hypothetical protein